MKTVKLALMTILVAATFAGQANAYSVTIDDSYIGTGTTGNYPYYETKDIIGSATIFDVQKMVVTFDSSNRLSTVDIHTSYVKPLLDVGASGTKLGDLFVSTNGYGTTDMLNDSMTTGEQWEYALVLNHHDFGSSLPVSRTIGLYGVAADRSNIVQSSAPGYIFRENQETGIDTSKGYYLGDIGTWNIDTTASGEYGTLSFELTNTALVDNYLGSAPFGFHWNMTCGNDTIEGGAAAPVPEPSTFILLGAGLLWAGLYRRKAKN